MVMGGMWRLDDASGVWLVQRDGWGAATGMPRGAEPLGAEAAIARVDAWFPEGWGADSATATLAQICLSLTGCLPGGDSPELPWLKRAVRQALRDGRLVAVHVALHAPAGGVDEEEDEAPAAQPAPREERTWIEIALVDDDDPPAPVPFKRYRVELPDGAVREGMLDQHGLARIAGIDPGTCKVTFPDFDERTWSAR